MNRRLSANLTVRDDEDREDGIAYEALSEAAQVAEANRRARLESDICIHIFSVSAVMVGACLTVIGMLRVVIAIRKRNTFADDLLAIDAFLFLVSCFSAYWALRKRTAKRMHRAERFADAVFMLAMVLMVFTCGFITYSVAAS